MLRLSAAPSVTKTSISTLTELVITQHARSAFLSSENSEVQMSQIFLSVLPVEET